jgi:hypothetical protein
MDGVQTNGRQGAAGSARRRRLGKREKERKENLSVAEILASLEAQMAFDKEREAYHVEQS